MQVLWAHLIFSILEFWQENVLGVWVWEQFVRAEVECNCATPRPGELVTLSRWAHVTLRDTVTLATNYYKRLLVGQYGYLPSVPRLGTRPAVSELKHISDSFKVTQIVNFRCSRKHITSSTSILDSTHMGISSKWMRGVANFRDKI